MTIRNWNEPKPGSMWDKYETMGREYRQNNPAATPGDIAKTALAIAANVAFGPKIVHDAFVQGAMKDGES